MSSVDEKGSVTLEVTVLFPGVLVIVFLVVQAALCWHAQNAALSAAQQGLAVARVAGISQGEARARQVANELGGVHSVDVTGAGDRDLTIVVSGSAPVLLPGVHVTVREMASGPAEGFRAP